MMMFPTSFEMHYRDGALGRHEVKDGYEQLVFKAQLQLVCSLQVKGGHATAKQYSQFFRQVADACQSNNHFCHEIVVSLEWSYLSRENHCNSVVITKVIIIL